MKSIKIIAALIFCTIVCAPVLMAFTEGSDGGPTSWNVIGIIYMFLLVKFPKFIFPSWVRTAVDSLVRDE